MLVDTHCHLDRLDLTKYDGRLEGALQAARDNDVQYFLCVAITLEQWPRVIEIAEHDPSIKATVGVHPNETEAEDPSEERLLSLAQHPEVVAIGETGLDYYRTEEGLDWQQERFRRHIRAARACHKPIIVHTRNAPEDTIRILQEENAQDVGGILHCFTESWEVAKQGIDIGFYVSFSGIVTFQNAKNVQDAAKKVPLSSLLVETDAPYLAPMPYRGKPNEPAYVRYTAEKIAELQSVDFEKVAEQTTSNYFQLFPEAKAAELQGRT